MDKLYIRTIDLADWLVNKYFKDKDLITIDDLLGLIEDLDSKANNKENELNDIIEDRDTNFKRIDYASQIRED